MKHPQPPRGGRLIAGLLVALLPIISTIASAQIPTGKRNMNCDLALDMALKSGSSSFAIPPYTAPINFQTITTP